MEAARLAVEVTVFAHQMDDRRSFTLVRSTSELMRMDCTLILCLLLHVASVVVVCETGSSSRCASSSRCNSRSALRTEPAWGFSAEAGELVWRIWKVSRYGSLMSEQNMSM